MFKTGLVSISFRKLQPVDIVDMVSRAGLDAIEWGGDIHVPHGDIKRAAEVIDLCRDNNISCPSYGSYYKVGEYETPEIEFKKILDCAEILGSDKIRVWAGVISTNESNEEHFTNISNELKNISYMAQEAGIGIALEFHANTLTDNARDTLRLLEAAGRKNITTYWQPPVNRNMEENLTDIRLLKGNISNIHTFVWQGRDRMELKDGYPLWVNYLKEIDDGKNRYCMLEFIKDDSLEIFYRDAITLKTLTELFN